MSNADHRLIEDYIPIEAISTEARREKSIRRGHISTLHLWWARRPLVACRAAVYGALVPAPEDTKAAKAAETFVTRLCKYPGSPDAIEDARQHILRAHAERLTSERGELVTIEDIEAGRAPRPRVLDMFAGGGAIPLEALRLGCEAYALDLNPVAHLIQLCTLVYPQQFGVPDPAVHGCSPDGTWAGLAAEVEHWGKWVLERVREEIADLYPPIPDPQYRGQVGEQPRQLSLGMAVQETRAVYNARAGMLTPVAYLWTRTVRCKNPACGATVPLARQTWLCRKKGRYVALKPEIPDAWEEKRVRYRVVEAATEEDLGFDPEAGSRSGNVACPFCGTVADNAYVKAEGMGGRIGVQPQAIVCNRQGKATKIYLAAKDISLTSWPDGDAIADRIQRLEAATANDLIGALTVPDETITTDSKGSAWVIQYGLTRFRDLFTPRQLLALLTFSQYVRASFAEAQRQGYGREQSKAVATALGMALDKLADFLSSLAVFKSSGGRGVVHTFGRQALPMVWDFAESNPFNSQCANWQGCLKEVVDNIQRNSLSLIASVHRASATRLPWEKATFDAVLTDPPYYDNVAYADLSDFFYVWLKRSIGFLYPEHFSSLLTPKKSEAVADATRHEGNRDRAGKAYEEMMAQSFAEANRVLKPGGPLVIVYAHKTTLGWSTLVDALRLAGFTVTEAWPIDTETSGRLIAQDTASLASSIFLIARRREGETVGSYEHDVQAELEQIVRERVERLWAQGVTGADLVIACVGAGLRAFTRFARVEYANGAPVPAERFLTEVEGVVLETLLTKLFGVSRAGVSGVDPATRFYVLWRYAYRQAALEAGEAIVFAYPQRIELDGARGLSAGSNPLVEKRKGQYLLRDFSDRGADEDLGLPRTDEPAPLVDVLHRLLWLVENRPTEIRSYLDQARPDVERLRLVAQTLAGQALSGNGEGGGRALVAARGAEAAALRKLTTNWRSLVEENLFRR